ncbi:arrestin-related trafficking adapter 6 [[Candida] anglica]|uniref:Arrestin-related trafficking adapter 6 n=1 Tax=[Candida] anglica TaxID=148631 RepID=A0ABP0EAA3_9ASCO
MQPNSPLFAPDSLVLPDEEIHDENSTLIPALPDKPLASNSSFQLYIIPAEKNLFIEGFDAVEYADRPPTLLRGCLYLRVLKPTKLKSISLTFKGVQRTDWPEGIPPKKNQYAEVNDVTSHTWPFYTQGNPIQGLNCGADHFQELPRSCTNSSINDGAEISNLSLAETQIRSISPLPMRAMSQQQLQSTALGQSESIGSGIGDFFSRTISLSPAAATIIKRATRSPSPSPSRSRSNTLNLNPTGSRTDLTSIISDDSNSKDLFIPGDYIYNFEHAIHPSTPESCKVTFGECSYYLEANIVRPGTFKSNVTVRHPVNIVRILASNNLEENEPIVITRDWEDQLQYDIIIGSKSVILNSYIPLGFRFVPLWGKVALHRIRVYLSENLEYYCHNKKVHRTEPGKKYLLLEHKAKKGKSLLSKSGGCQEDDENEEPDADEEEVLPRELEFQVYVPQVLKEKFHHEIHPDTSFTNIQAHHWMKICLRISRIDPNNPEKRKHYEISIDSPIRILSHLHTHDNTLLPVYESQNQQTCLPLYSPSSPPLSPGVIPVDGCSILGNLNNASNSLDAVMETNTFSPQRNISARIPPVRELSPSGHEFHHLHSPDCNDVPMERDRDMHLEANLYKPKEEDCEPVLRSLQAVPFESPVGSPIQRSVQFVRKPSINPPAFDDVAGPPIDHLILNPPPEYEEEDTLGRQAIGPEEGEEEDDEEDDDSKLVGDEDYSRRGRSRGNPQNVLVIPPSPTESEPASAPLIEPRSQDDEQDIVDTYEPTRDQLSPKLNSNSRKSSVSSLASSSFEKSIQTPIEGIPLLNESTTSLDVGANSGVKSRNSSIISFLNNATRQNATSMNLNTSDDLYHINGNLLSLRNPRIKKHYQEEEIDQDEHSTISKLRQKSFGVVDDPRLQISSESDDTSTEEQREMTTTESKMTNQVEGLNLGYIIE